MLYKLNYLFIRTLSYVVELFLMFSASIIFLNLKGYPPPSRHGITTYCATYICTNNHFVEL